MAVSYRKLSLKSTNVRMKTRVKQQMVRFSFLSAWTLFPGLTGKLVKQLFFRPAAYPTSDEQKRVLQSARAFTFMSEGSVLQAYQWGEGPAVLLVHGWAGRGIQFYRYVSKLVSRGYTVVTFDHAAHGQSQGRTANYFLFSNAVYDLWEQVPDLNIQAVVAHSLGASAVINCLWRTGKKPVTVFIAPALHLVEMLDQTFARYGLPNEIFTALIDEIGARTNHTFSKENPIDLLKTLTHDIMIIHDTDDRAVAYEDSWNAGLVQNNISLFPTKGLGHIRILEDAPLIDLVVKKIVTG